MSRFIGVLVVSFAFAVMALAASLSTDAAENGGSVLNRKMKALNGKEVDLNDYQGKVVLIVNVASKCGLTPQYTQLQALHEKYSDQGLSILGFPCNQFGKQEPGSADEIRSFCTENYGVKFDMFAKVDVNGNDACDLYKELTKLNTEPAGAGDISWNFEKFLVGRDGKVIARFAPRTKPDSEEVIQAIEAALTTKS